MAVPFARIQRVVAWVAAHPDENISLGALAAKSGLSPFHLHRVFSTAVGETPKRLTMRLRLGRSAVLLLTSDHSVLDVALSCGFQSHEVFCRAFRRHFGMAPGAYRRRGFAGNVRGRQARNHAVLMNRIAPCVGLYGMSQEGKVEPNDMTYTVTKVELAPQPVLLVRCRVKRSEIASTIAVALHKVFAYSQEHGIALAGLPLTRYPEIGHGMVTMEPGMRIVDAGPDPEPAKAESTPASTMRKVVRDTLPGGPVAMTLHTGPYEKLPDAYAAIEQWMEAEGLSASGDPWESYVTDPGDYPDPAEWKTEVFWPLWR